MILGNWLNPLGVAYNIYLFIGVVEVRLHNTRTGTGTETIHDYTSLTPSLNLSHFLKSLEG